MSWQAAMHSLLRALKKQCFAYLKSLKFARADGDVAKRAREGRTEVIPQAAGAWTRQASASVRAFWWDGWSGLRWGCMLG